MTEAIIICLLLGLAVIAWLLGWEDNKADDWGFTAADRAAHGSSNCQMICPHCHTQGKVMSKPISKKVGISGGKATGALLTGGISLLATGLSRKEMLTEAYCTNCTSTWQF